MSTIAKPHTFSPNTTISSSQVNADFDTLYNDYNGSIDASNLATSAVSTAKIADGAVTTAKIADSNVTTAKLNLGWVSYTPTLSNFTIGNGTMVAMYVQVGMTIIGMVHVTLGSTSSMGAAGIRITTPVAASTNYSVTNSVIGQATFQDSGSSQYVGWNRLEDVNTMRPVVLNASATYTTISSLTASVPMTWATNDVVAINFSYERA